MTSIPDAALVDRARNGDRLAGEAVLEGIRPVLKRFFTSRIGAGPDVDDLVQNALVRVHRGLPDLHDPSRLKSFAMKAAVFELQDFYRGRYSMKEGLFDPSSPPDDPHDDETGAMSIDADRVLAAVTPHARRILELRAYGYRYEEIAAIVGSTEGAVKMQVKRALDKLRRLFLVLIAAGATLWSLAFP